jgi:hypothetical protein
VQATPGQRTIEQGIKQELAARDGSFNAVPAPAQMRNVGQHGPRKAPLAVSKLAGEQGDEHDADKLSGACRQTANQIVNRTSGQVTAEAVRWSDGVFGLDTQQASPYLAAFRCSIGKTRVVSFVSNQIKEVSGGMCVRQKKRSSRTTGIAVG